MPILQTYALAELTSTILERSTLTSAQDFGEAIALSGDGNTLVVSASQDNGTLYLYRFETGEWTYKTKVRSPGSRNQKFGHSFDLTHDGNWLVVGVPESTSFHGFVTLYHLNGDLFVPVKTYSAPQGGKRFGSAVAFLSSGRVVVGDAFGRVDIFESFSPYQNVGAQQITGFGDRAIHRIEANADNRIVVSMNLSVGTGRTHVLSLYDVNNLAVHKTIPDTNKSAALRSDGSQYATVENYEVTLYDASNDAALKTFLLGDLVDYIEYSLDGTEIYISTSNVSDTVIYVYSTDSPYAAKAPLPAPSITSGYGTCIAANATQVFVAAPTEVNEVAGSGNVHIFARA